MKSDDHIALSQIAAIFLREAFNCPSVAIEPRGVGPAGEGTGRDYDVLGVKGGKTNAIIGVEVKVTRVDFVLGYKKGQFNQRDDITELWLCYPGHFNLKELPPHVGILEPRNEPLCVNCFNASKTFCDCKNVEKTILLKISRPAKTYEEGPKAFAKYYHDWLYRISTANTTLVNHYLKANYDI